jgi:L-asparaginase/Glu-tRNA(Gln) amidotransferase subunit D
MKVSAPSQFAYQAPSWIADNGTYLKDHNFNPAAFDPSAPYAPGGKTFRLKSNDKRRWEDVDLLNLRFIEPQTITALLQDLEEKVEHKKPIVCVPATGGTIAMTRMESGFCRPTLSVEDLMSELGGRFQESLSICGVSHRTLIDSSQQEIDYLADLVIVMAWIWEHSSQELKDLFQGFMILHGTDTIDAAAPYLAMMLGPDCPFTVGLVGAQRMSSDRFSDVPINLRFAFDAFAQLRLENVTTCFVFGGGTGGAAYRATGVTKVSDRRIDFLDASGHDPLIKISRDITPPTIARFEREYRKRRFFRPLVLRGYRRVLAIGSELGFDPATAYTIISTTPEPALLFKTFGCFTANTKFFKAVSDAVARTGKILFVTNQIFGGSLDHQYEDSVQLQLRSNGAVPVDMLPAVLAAKVSLGLEVYGENRAKLIDFVQSNYVGEQIDWQYGESTGWLGTPDDFHDDCEN